MRLEHPPRDRLHLHHVARDLERLRALEALAQDLDRDLRALLAAHQVHGLEQRHVLARAARLGPVRRLLGGADRRDLIARLDARLRRRRALDRRDDLDVAILALADLDAEPVELAPGVDLHLLVGLGVEEGRVRIELGEHAPHGALHQRALVDRLDVVAAHEVQHAREHREIFVARRREAAGAAREHARDGGGQHAREEREEETDPVSPHGVRPAFAARRGGPRRSLRCSPWNRRADGVP